MNAIKTIGKRIETVMNKELMNFRSFGKKIKISDVVVGNVIKGRNKPSFDFISAVLQTFDWINSDWLMTGRGEMLKKGISDGSYSNNVVGGSVNMNNNNSNNNQLATDDNLFLENAFLKKEVKILREQLEMQKKFIEILEKK